MSENRAVVLMTTEEPGPINKYVIDRVLSEGLVQFLVFVQPEGWRWKLRQFRNTARRSGIAGVRRRLEASRLQREQLGESMRRFLDEGLGGSADVFERIPDSVRVERAGRLNVPATCSLLRSLEPAVAVQAGAGWVRSPLIGVPPLGFLSLHHGIMPEIRGMDSIPWAYVNDRPDWCGVTLQLIDEGLDTGRIIYQEALPPEEGENPYSVMARATLIGAELMVRGIRAVLGGPLPDPPPPRGKGVYRSALSAKAVRGLREMIDRGEVPRGM